MTSCILRGLYYEDLAFSGGFSLPAPPSRRVRFGQNPYVGSSFHLLQLCNPPHSCPPWMLQHLAIVVCNQVAHNARPARRRVVARPRKESALSHSCSLPRQLPCAPGVAALPEGQLLQKGAEIGLGDESERRGVLDLDLRPRKARSNINCWLPRQAAAVTKKVKKIGDSSNSPPQSAAVVHHLSHLRQHAV